MKTLPLFVAVILGVCVGGCAARYPADAINPPTNTFGPRAGTPDIAPTGTYAETKAHRGTTAPAPSGNH